MTTSSGRIPVTRGTLGQRITAVGCLVLATVVVSLFYFISKGFSKDIGFATLERSGNQYQRPLEDLLEAIPEHQLLVRRYLAGQHEVESQLAEIEKRVDAAIETLGAVDSHLGKTLQFTPEGLAARKREHYHWDNLHQEWEALRRGWAGKSVENSDKSHEHLVEDVRTMITHAGDTSNLILDPELDSYYLVDVTLATLPQTQERLAGIEKLGQDVLTKSKITEDQRVQFAVAVALLKKADLDRITGDVQTALSEDPNFHGASQTLQQNLPPAVEEYAKANEKLLGLLHRIADSSASPVPATEFATAAGATRKASFRLWHTGAQELDTLLQMRMDDLARMRRWALAWTALALVLSFGIAAQVLRATVKPLSAMSWELLSHSIRIASASQQIAAASQSLANGASEQAASLEQTSASTEQISSMAARNSANARGAAELVTASQQKFSEANRSLDERVTSIGEISAENGKISKVIKVIDEIAFRTNILALNAAVEAARAGESGAGFAVVADEVRGLAQRCAQAARETASLIEGSIAKSSDGKERVGQLAAAIRAITGESAKIKELVDEVNLTSQQQTRGVEQIARAFTQIERAPRGNAAGAEQNSACVEELKAQSGALRLIAQQISAIVGDRVS